MAHSKNAHAARIEDGIVQEVIVIPYEHDSDADITAYCNSIGLPGTWIDTSYTGSRRRRFAGVGMTYDSKRNAFILPQPFPSWTLDSVGDWQPPTPMPTDGEAYVWDEDAQGWQPVTE